MARKVHFDVDTGCDDAIMLLVAVAADDLDVVGATTVFGNAPLAHTTENTKALLEYVGRGEVPVAAGAARPLVSEGEPEVGPDDLEGIHGDTGLTTEFPPAEGELVDDHAANLIVEQAREHGEDLTIAAVGPQTNLALALAIEPDLPDLVEDIYVMGGAATVPGNVRPTAEFNFYADPEAARRVFQADGVTMVGLDATEQTHVPFEAIDSLAEGGEPHRRFAELMDYYPGDSLERYGYEGPVVHDSVVAADLVGDVLSFEEHYVAVAVGDEFARGQSVADVRDVFGEDATTRVALEADVDRYQSIVLDSLEDLADDLA